MAKILKTPEATENNPVPEQHLVEVALRWLKLGSQAFVNEALESARAEQQHIKETPVGRQTVMAE